MSWSADHTYRRQMVTIFGYFQNLSKPKIYKAKALKLHSSPWKLLVPHYIPEMFLGILRSDMGNIQIIPQGFSYISYIDFSGNHAVKSPLIALKMYPLVFHVMLRDRAVIQGPDPQQVAVHTMCRNPVRHHCVKICRLWLKMTEIKGIPN